MGISIKYQSFKWLIEFNLITFNINNGGVMSHYKERKQIIAKKINEELQRGWGRCYKRNKEIRDGKKIKNTEMKI